MRGSEVPSAHGSARRRVCGGVTRVGGRRGCARFRCARGSEDWCVFGSGGRKSGGSDPSVRRTIVEAPAFGTQACDVAWLRHGLTIGFYNLGGGDACDPAAGRFSRAMLRGDHWMTTNRLRIGDSVARLRQLYPDADLRPGYEASGPRVTGCYPGIRGSVTAGFTPDCSRRSAAGGSSSSRSGSPPAATRSSTPT